jgi:hypothetical protein
VTGHPDADVLAELREGLLGRRRSGRIRAHLAECPDCAAVSRGLAEVTALLAGAPAPRMPDELVTRLDSVLAAETAARAARDGSATQTGSATRDGGGARDGGRDRGGRSRRPRRVPSLRVATAAAAVLAVAGGGYGITRLVHSSPAAGSGASAADRPLRSAAGPKEPAAAGSGVAPSPQLAGPLSVVSSGTDYQPGQLTAQVGAVLHRYPANPPLGTSNGARAQGSRLAGCVKLIAGGAQPRLVDVARYRGQPASIIVLPAPQPQDALDQVWVVGSGCSATSRDVIAHTQLAAG